MVTTIGVVVTTVAVADPDLVGSAVDFAVIVTLPPGGTLEGPSKVAATPLAVCGVMPPQFDAPQLTDQSTPAAAVSLATSAVN
jgi:hypothetical protein